MNLNRTGPVALAVGLLAGGLAFSAVVDHTPPRPPPSAGFGSLSTQHGTARTDAWAAVASVAPGIAPDSDNACERGDDSCLDAVVGEMEARLELLGCAHTGPFASTYLEMTRGVQRRLQDPGYFAVPAGTANFDALFGRAYFDAIDNWSTGRRDDVPGAWQVAFGAAEGGHTSAAADLLLGMNAHIARDLPYIVASAIAANPAIADDPEDFLKVNDVIAEVKGPMLRGVADRFDPAIAALDQPVSALAQDGSVDLIAKWRNHAFDLGRQLALAPPAGKAAIAALIEREAVATAALILNADATDTIPHSVGRDAYCEQRR
jgi:hypothetical protein